jgi:K+-transporting ATPase c subunit
MTLTIVIGVLSAVLLVLGLGIVRMLRLSRLQSEQIQAMQNQMSALCAGSAGLDERILRFEQALSKVRDHQHSMDMVANSQSGYDHAIRLARKGADPSQLIQNCNLSDEEAHLISRLHGRQSSKDVH